MLWWPVRLKRPARVAAVKRGIFLAPFDELADPRVVAALAADAEARSVAG